MICVCRPWRGSHLPECPCQAVYEEIRANQLAECPLSDAEAEQLGAALVRDGWKQQSRKYRRVVKVPSGSSALGEIERLDPAEAARLRDAAAKSLENAARQQLWHYRETRELSLKVFEAFRRAAARKED